MAESMLTQISACPHIIIDPGINQGRPTVKDSRYLLSSLIIGVAEGGSLDHLSEENDADYDTCRRALHEISKILYRLKGTN